MKHKKLRKLCVIIPVIIIIAIFAYWVKEKPNIPFEQELTFAGIILLMFAIASITFLFARGIDKSQEKNKQSREILEKFAAYNELDNYPDD